ncbi:MAG: N-(5'-phosphoribosyl)anthranilate isomerase [Sulfolobaceae archaeon]|nr:N-(5'-phosphoribosyl)anthranilate isomerase [Stygiolobus sp.]
MVKVKFCGISHIEDAISAEKTGADMIGVVVDYSSPRYVKYEFIKIVKRFVSLPVVMVKVNGSIDEIVKEGQNADLIQIHRVLSKEELGLLHSYSKRFILYVPASNEYKGYFKSAISSGFDVLVDVPKKGEKLNLSLVKEWVREYSDVGIGGGITPDNAIEYASLNPKWIDISSGIEKYKGKKDLEKMRKIVEVIKGWRFIQ